MRTCRFVWNVVLLCMFPLSTITAKDVMTGTCGSDIRWRITDKYELILEGNGAITRYYTWTVDGETGTLQNHDDDFFPNDRITKITLKGNLIDIDNIIFDYFPSYTEITLPKSDDIKIIDGIIFSADMTRILRFPPGRKGTYSVPEGVVELGESAFMYSSLNEVQLPATLRTIERWCFVNSNMERLNVPEGVETIGIGIFQYCYQLKSIYLSSTVREAETLVGGWCEAFERYEVSEHNQTFCAIDGVLYSKDKIWLWDYPEGKKDIEYHSIPGLKTVAEGAFVGNPHLEKVVFDKDVEWISTRSFYNCENLSSVTISEGVYHVGYDAFQNCPSIKEIYWNAIICDEKTYDVFEDVSAEKVVFGEHVKQIPASLLENFKNLKKLHIPASVEQIGTNAFAGCVNVEEIYWDAIACADFERNYLRSNNRKDEKIKVKKFVFGNKVKRIPAYACSEFEELEQVLIPQSVTEIGNHAFWGCHAMKNINLNSSVKSVGDYAFGYTPIERFVFPKSIEHCGTHLFIGCDALNEVIWMPENYADFNAYNSLFIYKDMEQNKFTYNIVKQITSIQFGEEVKTIPNGFCAWLYNLKSITLPESVEIIGHDAFAECRSLQNIDMPSNVKSIGMEAFYNCIALQRANLSFSLEEIGDYGFKNCTALTDLVLPVSLKRIGQSAFYNCNKIKSIVLPEGLKQVDSGAFLFAHSDTYITIPAGLTDIGNIAFSCMDVPGFIVEGNNPKYSAQDGFLYNKNKTTFIASSKNATGKVKLPSSVEEIAEGAFANTQIETVDLPNKLTTIAPSAFYGSTITSITIPKGVTVIKSTTFQKCEKLKKVKFKNKQTVVEEDAFESTTELVF